MSLWGFGFWLSQQQNAPAGGGGGGPLKLSTTDNTEGTSPGHLTYTNSDLTIQATGSGVFGCRSTGGKSSGKYYWEETVDVLNDFNCAGIANASASLSASIWGNTANANAAGAFGATLRYNTTTAGTTFPTNGNKRCWALDLDNNILWLRYNNGAWTNAGDPAAGTGGISIAGMTKPIFVGWQGDLTDQSSFNFAGPFTYTAPSGFGVWTL